jgi:transcriptional regulator with XRE-family HTH domain
MNAAEIKQEIKLHDIDRRELAEKIGISPVYLNLILNGWVELKQEHEEKIKKELFLITDNNNNNKMICSKIG